MGLSLQHLLWYTDEEEDMLNRIVIWEEPCVRHCHPESKRISIQQKHPTSPSVSTKKFKVTPSAWKIMLTVFWNSQGIILAHFLKCGENVKSESYCELLLKLREAIHRKLPN
jgi:hypothetical protein